MKGFVRALIRQRHGLTLMKQGYQSWKERSWSFQSVTSGTPNVAKTPLPLSTLISPIWRW
jgi:hypothetical protein